MKTLGHDSLYPGQDLNPLLPGYEARMLSTRSRRSLRLVFNKWMFIKCLTLCERTDIVVVYSVWLQTGIPGFDPRQRIFPVASVSRPALRPPSLLSNGYKRVLSLGVKRGRGVTLTTHRHLVPRWRMARNYTSSPPRRLHGGSGRTFLFNDTPSIPYTLTMQHVTLNAIPWIGKNKRGHVSDLFQGTILAFVWWHQGKSRKS
jgi:hypothetical protein